ncbi:1,2-phenylacetyl-CoA epoxidase subunit PaaC [Saccharopolyspora gloriosae]|uniref:1,2-phenylacetyl-CoA epoxidase subunit PaaC n=1 Tax=Saccharopolyspora gloriosae TaxID=455344 RepID=UPI001FB808DC|nr:1,2-phenylacetyl-CoA epoxidase subunit PaaC [Saccharopolyspora gloriosae]
MSFDNAYEALTEQNDTRWAFGTGFDDPLAGVDTAVPPGVDEHVLSGYCLMLADDALIASQRLGEWVTRAPELEDEVALANIALDLLGQARLLLARSGQAGDSVRSEDELAYFRDSHEFRNVLLVEQPHGDFAETVARLLVLSSWRLALFTRLTASKDPVLAAIAAKGAKELAYHRDYAAQWVVRLGDGTTESHRRMRTGFDQVQPHVAELFAVSDVERDAAAQSVGVDPAATLEEVTAVLEQVCTAATVDCPRIAPGPQVSGRVGSHTAHLDTLLAELQGVARAHPEATW